MILLLVGLPVVIMFFVLAMDWLERAVLPPVEEMHRRGERGAASGAAAPAGRGTGLARIG